jgi:DeoR family transcriptional regulator, aga operon transcriptional repressor
MSDFAHYNLVSSRFAHEVNLIRASPVYHAAVRRAERLGAILEELSDGGAVDVGALSERLGASPATIRRDLLLLDQQKLLTRTHGGAVAQGVAYELPLRYKAGRNQEAKGRIAAEAAARAGEGMAIGLTGGTTTTEVARAIVDVDRLTVVTNALNIAGELAIRRNLKLVVTGGWARSESYELVGPLAEESLAGLNLDIAFLGVDGISADAGLTTHHEVEAHTNFSLLERAERAIVVADGSKVGKVAFARICPLDRVGELITDGSADPVALEPIREAGIAVTIV